MEKQMKIANYVRRAVMLTTLFAGLATSAAFAQEARVSVPSNDSTADTTEEKPFRPRQFADWRDLPSDIVEQKEVREAIWKALGELSDIYREVFVLRDVQHLDVADTAQVLGISESAVKIRLHRARLMMRESLSPIFAKPKGSMWDYWKGMNPWLAAKR
jgi:RNA polymerase sigma-70 factor, ECF subfamily